jgi:hypothetical protein
MKEKFTVGAMKKILKNYPDNFVIYVFDEKTDTFLEVEGYERKDEKSMIILHPEGLTAKRLLNINTLKNIARYNRRLKAAVARNAIKYRDMLKDIVRYSKDPVKLGVYIKMIKADLDNAEG